MVVMADAKIIYVVTTGEYSDYRIDSVWDDEDAANKRARLAGGMVEKYSLNEPENSIQVWTVRIDVNGVVQRASMMLDNKHPTKQFFMHDCGDFFVYVVADDEKTAVKSAKDYWRVHFPGEFDKWSERILKKLVEEQKQVEKLGDISERKFIEQRAKQIADRAWQTR